MFSLEVGIPCVSSRGHCGYLWRSVVLEPVSDPPPPSDNTGEGSWLTLLNFVNQLQEDFQCLFPYCFLFLISCLRTTQRTKFKCFVTICIDLRNLSCRLEGWGSCALMQIHAHPHQPMFAQHRTSPAALMSAPTCNHNTFECTCWESSALGSQCTAHQPCQTPVC